MRDRLKDLAFEKSRLEKELETTYSMPLRNLNGFSNWRRVKELQRLKRALKVNETNTVKAMMENEYGRNN
jgi:hypothetical protein